MSIWKQQREGKTVKRGKMIERTLRKLEPGMSVGLLKTMACRIHTELKKNHRDLPIIRDSTNLQLVRLRERAIMKALIVVLNHHDVGSSTEGHVLTNLKKKTCNMKIDTLVDNMIILGRLHAYNENQGSGHSNDCNVRAVVPLKNASNVKKPITKKPITKKPITKKPIVVDRVSSSRSDTGTGCKPVQHTDTRDLYERLRRLGYSHIENPGQGDCLYYAVRDSAIANGLWHVIGPNLPLDNNGVVRYLRNCTARALLQYGQCQWNDTPYTIESLPTVGTNNRGYGAGSGYSLQDFIDYEVVPAGRYGEHKAIIGLALAFGVV